MARNTYIHYQRALLYAGLFLKFIYLHVTNISDSYNFLKVLTKQNIRTYYYLL